MVQQRHEDHVLVAKMHRCRDAGDRPDTRSRVIRRQVQGQQAAGGKADHVNLAAVGPEDIVTALDRIRPVVPVAFAQIPRRSAVSLEPHAEHVVAVGMQALAEAAQLGRAGHETVHQQHRAGRLALRLQEITVGIGGLGLLGIDFPVAFALEAVVIPAVGNQLVVEAVIGDFSRAELFGPHHCPPDDAGDFG